MSKGFSSSATVFPRPPPPGRPPAPIGGRGPAGGLAPGAGLAGSGVAGFAPAAPGFAAGAPGLAEGAPLADGAGVFPAGLPFMEAPQNGHSVTSSSRTEALQAGQVRKSIGFGRRVEELSSASKTGRAAEKRHSARPRCTQLSSAICPQARPASWMRRRTIDAFASRDGVPWERGWKYIRRPKRPGPQRNER